MWSVYNNFWKKTWLYERQCFKLLLFPCLFEIKSDVINIQMVLWLEFIYIRMLALFQEYSMLQLIVLTNIPILIPMLNFATLLQESISWKVTVKLSLFYIRMLVLKFTKRSNKVYMNIFFNVYTVHFLHFNVERRTIIKAFYRSVYRKCICNTYE